MAKEHFDGAYTNAREIPPTHLLAYYLTGDNQERKEARSELLRRLIAYDGIKSIIKAEEDE